MIDAIIIGGSFAGLTAALQLARASRSVTVIDAGTPRNRASSAAHGVAGWDGTPPSQILDRFRADLAAYPTVSIIMASVTDVSGVLDDFRVETKSGDIFEARRLILAHGVRDILPDIPGLQKGWGHTVLHCPYCHGYEVKGQALAVLAVHPMSAHQALMLRTDWSDQVTLITGGMEGFDHVALDRAGVIVDRHAVEAAEVRDDGITLTLEDGTSTRFAALFVGPETSLTGSPAEQIGCAVNAGPMGPFVRVGPMAQTSVNGVFAAGDVAHAMPNINFALADGAQAGTACHASLLFPEFIPALEDII